MSVNPMLSTWGRMRLPTPKKRSFWSSATSQAESSVSRPSSHFKKAAAASSTETRVRSDGADGWCWSLDSPIRAIAFPRLHLRSARASLGKRLADLAEGLPAVPLPPRAASLLASLPKGSDFCSADWRAGLSVGQRGLMQEGHSWEEAGSSAGLKKER